jgi:hypothetical protein
MAQLDAGGTDDIIQVREFVAAVKGQERSCWLAGNAIGWSHGTDDQDRCGIRTQITGTQITRINLIRKTHGFENPGLPEILLVCFPTGRYGSKAANRR